MSSESDQRVLMRTVACGISDTSVISRVSTDNYVGAAAAGPRAWFWLELADPSLVSSRRAVRVCLSVAVTSDGRPVLPGPNPRRPGGLLSPLLSDLTPSQLGVLVALD